MEIALSARRIGSVASNPTCDLRAKHRRQLQILAVCTKSTPPVQQSVRAGVQRCVLEQGECSRSCGQQLIVRGAARRTVD